MGGVTCSGWVDSLDQQELVFTGRVVVDGQWTHRNECRLMAKARGARADKTDFSGKITLVVHGDLASQVVQDETRHYSQTLVLAADRRQRGQHVCVIDGAGFSDLLHGYPARCRQLRSTMPGSRQRLVLPETGDGILGGPLRQQRVPQHDDAPLRRDLTQLDRGTAAHEATLTALVEHLGRKGVLVQAPARHAPRFDAGWTVDDGVYIAEVKSLGDANQDQQIRLGLGQVLDYVHQLQRQQTVGMLRPVLVLERRPSDDRWPPLFASRDIVLTWAPTFLGC